MEELFFKNIDEFFKSRGIIKTDNLIESGNGGTSVITERLAADQLKLISEFHKKTMGFTGFAGKRINNYTGKKVEEFKVHVKKLKRDISKLEAQEPENTFELLLLQRGEEFLRRAEACISKVYESRYYDLITRSMKRIELCLGNTYHDNLIQLDDNKMQIFDTKHCGYNMVECDGIYYLNKLKKRGFKFDWKGLIDEFCYYEVLESSSKGFMIALLSYPYEFMKCCNRYRYRKKDWDDEQYAENLRTAIRKDEKNVV